MSESSGRSCCGLHRVSGSNEPCRRSLGSCRLRRWQAPPGLRNRATSKHIESNFGCWYVQVTGYFSQNNDDPCESFWTNATGTLSIAVNMGDPLLLSHPSTCRPSHVHMCAPCVHSDPSRCARRRRRSWPGLGPSLATCCAWHKIFELPPARPAETRAVEPRGAGPRTWLALIGWCLNCVGTVGWRKSLCCHVYVGLINSCFSTLISR